MQDTFEFALCTCKVQFFPFPLWSGFNDQASLANEAFYEEWVYELREVSEKSSLFCR